MKPVIIFVDRETDKVSFDAKEFKKICNDIYQQAYDDGYNAGKNNYWYSYPYVMTTDKITLNPNSTGTHDKWWNDITISCQNNTTAVDSCQNNTTAVDNSFHMPTESNDCVKPV